MRMLADNLKRFRLRSLWRSVRGDGCTNAPDFHSDYTHCCNGHDSDYTSGSDEKGNEITRKQADIRLLKCMKNNSKTALGKYVISPIYYIAVRLFGANRWNGKTKN